MGTAADRLRRARIEHGQYDNAADAAAAFGWNYNTYASNENGNAPFSFKAAQRYAKAYGVRAEWLYDEVGPMKIGARPALCEVVGRVGADPEGRILYSTGDRPIAYAPVPPGGNERQPVLLVVGDSMPGFAPNGSLIYLEDQRTPPSAEMLGEVVAVELEGGEVLLKRLLRGSDPGVLWDLESIAGPTRRDERIVWAAFIYCVVPPRAARRILTDLTEAA